jgi:hypothetical protein
MRTRILYTEASGGLGATLMNKTGGERKGTSDSKRSSFRVVEVAVLFILASLALLYERFATQITVPELIILTIAVIFLWLLAAISAAWFFSQPRELLNDLRHAIDLYGKEGELLHFELRATLREALERQPYVDEDMLSIIEANANNIWVVSTDLRNDITPGKIRDSVEANLTSGKHYTYFVPSPTNPNFPDAASNERSYKAWRVYTDHRDQIRFIHLPDDTLFLFREVVIYNPLANPNSEEATTPKGFTYFETATDARDRLMKIPDSYLQFLKGQLHRYSEDIGLNSEIERLIPELRNRLASPDFGYLGSLIGQRRIEDRQEFKKFLASVRQRDVDASNLLEKVLGRYIE